MGFPSPSDAPIRPTTRALAAMQTRINAAGLALFEGDLDRFVIFALIMAQTHPRAPGSRPIAAYSLAMSLDRPFETVRRHVNALIDAGLCARIDGRIVIAPESDAQPRIVAVRDLAHDSFVRFVEDMHALALVPPLAASTQRYDPMTGVAAAVDIMLAAVVSNRLLHEDWLSLTLFSSVILANAQRHEADSCIVGEPLGPRHAVRTSALARALRLPETTVRRRATRLTAPGGPLLRVTQGLIASRDWLSTPAAAETSVNTYAAIRLVLTRAAANGFAFDRPERAYLHGPPALPSFD